MLLALLISAAIFPDRVSFTFSVAHSHGVIATRLPHAAKPRQEDPPNQAYIDYSGNHLTSSDRVDLRRLKNRTSYDFTAPGGQAALPVVRDAERAIWKLAKKLRGYIVDEDSNQIFSPDSFRRLRMERPQNVLTQALVLHDFRSDGFARLQTGGLTHLGQRELEIEQLAGGETKGLGDVLNLIAQTLLENPAAVQGMQVHLDLRTLQLENLKEAKLYPNATQAATVTLAQAKDGTLRLDFGPDPQVEQHRLIEALYGGEDSMVQASHSGKVREVSDAARKRLLEVIKPRWRGPQDGRLEVKRDFDDREYMWIEVQRWEGNVLFGVLDNDPELVKDLHVGSHVSANEAEVFDYVLTMPDGGSEGNTTAEYLRRQ